MPKKVPEDKPCDLCGLPVKVAGFELKTAECQKSFCCLGCKSIYILFQGNREKLNLSTISDVSQQK